MFRSRRTLPAAVSPIFEPSNLQACQPALRPPLRSQFHAKCEKITPLFSHSSALFCHGQYANPFLFNRSRTLSQKHRGWSTPQLLSTPDPCVDSQKHASASPLLATLTDAINHKPCICHSYKNTGVYTPPQKHFLALCYSLPDPHPPRLFGQCRFGTYCPSVQLMNMSPCSLCYWRARGVLGPRRGRCYAIVF
jgi:hypothetical protein